MVTIDILRWGDPIGTSAWDPYARSELKKRLRRGVRAAPDELRHFSRLIHAREPVTIRGVSEDAIYGLTQILESTGADFRILFDVDGTSNQPTRSNSP